MYKKFYNITYFPWCKYIPLRDTDIHINLILIILSVTIAKDYVQDHCKIIEIFDKRNVLGNRMAKYFNLLYAASFQNIKFTIILDIRHIASHVHRSKIITCTDSRTPPCLDIVERCSTPKLTINWCY